MEINENTQKAAYEYLNRKAGKSHPQGKTDKGGRWFPSDAEDRKCCRSVRSPSRAFPWNIYKHCFSAGHIAELYSVDPKELRKAIKVLEPAFQCLNRMHIPIDTSPKEV